MNTGKDTDKGKDLGKGNGMDKFMDQDQGSVDKQHVPRSAARRSIDLSISINNNNLNSKQKEFYGNTNNTNDINMKNV